jgi:hypothetical protein
MPTGVTIIFVRRVGSLQNRRQVFEESAWTCVEFSSNTTMRCVTRAHERLLWLPPCFHCLGPPTTVHPKLGSTWLHLSPKLKKIWEDITYCQTMTSRYWWICGSVNKTRSSVIMVLSNYPNVGGRFWTAEVIMLRSDYAKLQNNVEEKYPVCSS